MIADSKSISKIAHDLPIGVINVDSNWNAVFINARCADMLKTSLDELYGRKWIDYLPRKISCLLHYLGVSGSPLAFLRQFPTITGAVVPMDNR